MVRKAAKNGERQGETWGGGLTDPTCLGTAELQENS